MNYILHIFVFIISFGLLAISADAQVSGNKPKLISTWNSIGDDLQESADNTAGAIADNLNDENNTIAVRICSNDPLPIIFALSPVSYVFSVIDKYYYSAGINRTKYKAFLLRQNKNCKLSNKNKYFTEYWIVPKNAELPEFVEARKLENVSYERLFDGTADNKDEENALSENWTKAKSATVEVLRKDKTALMLIEILPRSSNLMLAKAMEIKTFLLSNKIGKNRIFIKEVYNWSASEDYPKEIYPTITVVHQN